MVKGLVYYAVEKVYSSALTYENLPANLKNHVHSVDSEYAWLLISKLYEKVNKKPLPKVEFLKSGKPVIDGGFISVSHSNGVVAICFSNAVSVGIDIELKREDYPLKVKDFLVGVTDSDSFYSTWTKREAVIKSKNLSALKKGVETEFVGLTKDVTVNEKAFSLSIYGENAEFYLISGSIVK